MGDNFSVNLSEDTMLKKSGRGASPEMMALLHSRCGIMPESDKKEILNSKRVKTITGDDTITARHLYGNLIQFKTQAKCIWPSNHLPKIDVDDQAILDRLKLVPFLARFAKTEDNTRYIKDLQENHMDEFFTFFATGSRDWYAGEELKPTTEMLEKMNDYISDYDTVQEFINDTYDVISEDEYNGLPKLEKNNNRTPKQYVYGCFVGWLNDNNRRDEMITKKEIFKSMTGKVKESKIGGKIYYLCRPPIHIEEDDDIFPM
jgi:putative DNA primase/helicase